MIPKMNHCMFVLEFSELSLYSNMFLMIESYRSNDILEFPGTQYWLLARLRISKGTNA